MERKDPSFFNLQQQNLPVVTRKNQHQSHSMYFNILLIQCSWSPDLVTKQSFPEKEAGIEAEISATRVRSSINTVAGRQTVFCGSPGFRGRLSSIPQTHFLDNEINKYRVVNF